MLPFVRPCRARGSVAHRTHDHLSGHPVGRLGHSALAAVAGHVSKAVHPLFQSQACSFLTATLHRLPASAGFSAPIIVGNNDHRFLIEEEAAARRRLSAADHAGAGGAQHGAAIAVAALYVARQDPAGMLVVMPSDHVIKDEPGFVEAVRRAAKMSATGKFVLFGITPDRPHTGYGYIRRGAPLPVSTAPTASMRSPRSPTSRRRSATLRPASYSLEQRHLRSRRSRLSRGAGAAGARHPGSGPGSARQCQGRSGLPAPR